MKYRLIILCILPLLASFIESRAQSYGLGFYSHEVVQDQRTGLDLSPGKTLCFEDDFELEFDLAFIEGRSDYFGYIARIVNSRNENIDFIYDKKLEEKTHFKVIVGDRFSNIAFNIPKEVLFKNWNKVKFKFDHHKNLLLISCGGYTGQSPLTMKGKGCYKILFGANEYQGFKTKDVPPMKIRDIRIYENGIKKYDWPLDEYKGLSVPEKTGDHVASVSNPVWIKRAHYDWQLVKSGIISGQSSVAFDAKKEVLYVVGPDALVSYDVKQDKFDTILYKSGRQNLMRGNQSIVESGTGKLINFYYDQRLVSTFDLNSAKWSGNFDSTEVTYYWHLNKFYCGYDSSLYVLGGYGHFIYKNQIERYHFPSGSWQKIKVSGDTLVPRYLAAAGVAGDGVYIMGGYGSSTGQQMLNPRNLYDLVYFDAKKRTIKKVYDLKINREDFVFSNSLIINEKDKSYYGMIFPKHKYNSHLQLIRGSLVNPEFETLGSQIPYLFHDINSFADLFYCPESKRFLAVTFFTDAKNQTTVNIYTLYGLPIAKLNTDAAASGQGYVYIVVLVLMAALASVFLIYRRGKNAVVREADLKKERAIQTLVKSEHLHKNTVFLFGDMQVFDKSGVEITRQFTPLIKELFLVILLYTIRWERGISSEKLKELLWMDKSVESARNNRSVNIAKLKSILEKISNCEVSMETGYWKINFNKQTTFIDYNDYLDIVTSKAELNRDKISRLAKVIKRGGFMSTAAYEWMDPFKSEMSNEIIDAYLHFARSVDISEDPELLIEVANYIFYFDSVNEEAMVVKCKALVHFGKHSQARKTYEDFCREYKSLYGDDFVKTFNQVLQSNLNEIS